MGFYHKNYKSRERGRKLVLAPAKLREEDLITLWSENGTSFLLLILLLPFPVFIHFFLSNPFSLRFFLSSSMPCILFVSFNVNLQWKYPESGVYVPYKEYPKLTCDMQCSMLCPHASHDQKILEFFCTVFSVDRVCKVSVVFVVHNNM